MWLIQNDLVKGAGVHMQHRYARDVTLIIYIPVFDCVIWIIFTIFWGGVSLLKLQ